jgi:hypothetical protein
MQPAIWSGYVQNVVPIKIANSLEAMMLDHHEIPIISKLFIFILIATQNTQYWKPWHYLGIDTMRMVLWFMNFSQCPAFKILKSNPKPNKKSSKHLVQACPGPTTFDPHRFGHEILILDAWSVSDSILSFIPIVNQETCINLHFWR